MEIIADREICIGAGTCAIQVPGFFDQDPEDGRVMLLNENISPSDAAAVLEVVQLCPSGALSVRDDRSSEG